MSRALKTSDVRRWVAIAHPTMRRGSFWYAFTGSDAEPADVRIRLRVFVGAEEAALLLDDKYDTVDKETKFNSFTFSPGDTKILSTSDGYTCGLEETGEGSDKGAVLVLGLPESTTDRRVLVRLLYQVNDGSGEFPRWTNAVSRSFPVPLEPGKESFLVLLQDNGGLEFSGVFRKKDEEPGKLPTAGPELRGAKRLVVDRDGDSPPSKCPLWT